MRLARAIVASCLGAAALVYGFYLAWPPLGFISAGALLLTLGLIHETGAET